MFAHIVSPPTGGHSTQHYAVMDYPPCDRKMERAGIMGDKPY